jgi:hypothetical protein
MMTRKNTVSDITTVMMICARHRECVGDETDHVGEEDEHEQAEDEWKEPPAFLACGRFEHVGDEIVRHLGDALQPPGNEGAVARADDHDERDQRHR